MSIHACVTSCWCILQRCHAMYFFNLTIFCLLEDCGYWIHLVRLWFSDDLIHIYNVMCFKVEIHNVLFTSSSNGLFNICCSGSDVCFCNIAMIMVSRRACQCQCLYSTSATLVCIVIFYIHLHTWIQNSILISALTTKLKNRFGFLLYRKFNLLKFFSAI